MLDFRFEQLGIWKDAIRIGNELFDIANLTEEKRKYRFAEQLNAATMSISNNIAEGSGSASIKEFARYISIARNSLFECVNIRHVYEMRGIVDKEVRESLIELSKKLYFFKQNLLNRK